MVTKFIPILPCHGLIQGPHQALIRVLDNIQLPRACGQKGLSDRCSDVSTLQGKEVAMGEHRVVITDRPWQRIAPAPLVPGKATDRGVSAGDNRLFLEAVFRGRWAAAPPGESDPLVSGRGTVRCATAAVGPAAVWLRGCSSPPAALPLWRSCPAPAPLSLFTRTLLVEKGH